MTSRHSRFGFSQWRVLALVVVGLLLLVYGIMRVGAIFDVFASRYTLVTMVSDVSGLREGAPVTVAGQRVGEVSEIDFVPMTSKQGNSHLRVQLEVNEDARDQIRGDSRVFLRAQGLLGDKFVDISPGTRSAPVLQPGDTIASQAAMDIEQFLTRGGAMLDSASQIVSDMRRITAGLANGEGTMGRLLTNDELYNRMIATTTELQSTLRGVNDPNGTIGRMLHDPAMYNRLMAAISRVDSIGNMVMRGRGTLGRLMASDSLYRGLFGTVTKADTAAANFSAFLNRMTTGNGTIQRLATDPRMYDELLKAVVDLQTLLAEVRTNPKKYVPPVQIKLF